jgi:hypothetical protein
MRNLKIFLTKNHWTLDKTHMDMTEVFIIGGIQKRRDNPVPVPGDQKNSNGRLSASRQPAQRALQQRPRPDSPPNSATIRPHVLLHSEQPKENHLLSSIDSTKCHESPKPALGIAFISPFERTFSTPGEITKLIGACPLFQPITARYSGAPISRDFNAIRSTF